MEDVIENDDLDAEGEDDPDYIRLPNGHYEKIDSISPIGIRNETGIIDAYPVRGQTADEAHFGGFLENVPKHLREMVSQFCLTFYCGYCID